jgi:hypothetical protein
VRLPENASKSAESVPVDTVSVDTRARSAGDAKVSGVGGEEGIGGMVSGLEALERLVRRILSVSKQVGRHSPTCFSYFFGCFCRIFSDCFRSFVLAVISDDCS